MNEAEMRTGKYTPVPVNEIEEQMTRGAEEISHTTDLVTQLENRLAPLLRPKAPASPVDRPGRLEEVTREPQSNFGCSLGSQVGLAKCNRLLLQDILNRLVL